MTILIFYPALELRIWLLSSDKKSIVGSDIQNIFLMSNSEIIWIILPIWANAKGDNYQSEHANTPSRRASRLVCIPKTHVRPPQGTHGARGGRSKSVIRADCRGHTLPPGGYKSVANWQAKCPDFRTIGALAAAADMRITPDLHRRSRKKSLHTFHKFFLVPHFSISLHIFSKSPICVLTRFWTLNVRYDAVGGPYGL